MSTKNTGLKYDVETSHSDESTENDVISSIKKAEYILKGVKKLDNKELLDKFNKEYDELKESIKKSLKEDRNITASNLTEIRLELADITELAEDNDIIESRNIFSKGWNKLWHLDTDKAETESEKLIEKNISEYSKDEALGALSYLNNSYSKIIDRYIEIGEDSISSLDSKSEINTFQDKLIEKILGENKGFNDKYIKGYNNIKGNYLVKISNFESTLKDKNIKGNKEDPNTINSMELAYYLLYLESKGELKKEDNSINTELLVNKFGTNNMRELVLLWEQNGENTIAQNILAKHSPNLEASIITIQNEQFLDIENKLKIESIEDKNIEFFSKIPEAIYQIKNPIKLIDIYSSLKTQMEDDIIEYAPLTLININKKLRDNIDVLLTVELSPLEFKLIPDGLFTKENSIKLLNKYNDYSYYLVEKFKEKGFTRTEIKDIFDKTGVEYSTNLKVFNSENNILSKKGYIKEIQEEKNIDIISKKINTYISYYGINELPKEISDKIILLIKKGKTPNKVLHLEINRDNLKIAKQLIEIHGIVSLQYLSDDLRGNKEVLEILIKNSTTEDIIKYSPYIEINSINNLLFIFTLIIDKHKNIEGEYLINKLSFGLLNTNIRNKILEVLENKKEGIILKKYEKAFNMLVKLIDETDKQINYIISLSKKIDKTKNLGKEEETLLKTYIEGKGISLKDYYNLIEGGDGSYSITRNIYLKISEKIGHKEAMLFIKDLFQKQNEYLKQNEKVITIDNSIINSKEIEELFFINKEGKKILNNDKLEKHFDNFYIEYKQSLKAINGTDKPKDEITAYLEKYFKSITEKELEEIKKIIKGRVKIRENNVKINDITQEEKTGKPGALSTYFKSGREEDKKALENLYYQDLKETVKERQKFKRRNSDSTVETKLLDESEYNETGNGYSFIANGEEIKITLEEKNLIENSEEAKENLIRTKNLLEDLNMGMIWNFRTAIFGVSSGNGFKINDGNYLNANELKLFLSKIIKSIEPELKEDGNTKLPTISMNLNEYIEGTKRLNKIGPIGGMKEVNLLGESYLENKFIEKFTDRYSSVSDFDALSFRKSLDNHGTSNIK